jgi:N4-(beta-N-acetylglucosaminyl)-L-asparaginase
VSITRRNFLGTGAATVAGLTLTRDVEAETATDAGRLPAAPFAGRPIVISSANSNTPDPRGKRGIQVAYSMLAAGADPLDAAIAGVNIVELNPNDQSVGLGGLPNEDGVVQLDASVMHGPTHRAGSVAGLEGIATPSLVAKAVMDYTDHIMLVGAGAKKFALQMGFKEQDLLTEASRIAWHKWKSRLNPNDNWLDIPPDQPAAGRGRTAMRESPESHVSVDERGTPRTTGTINMCAVDAKGDIGSVTTTSGLSWKVPGRIGDSPIIGAGQYCDNTVGAAGSTGRGEANIKVCGAFLAVEFMRQGMTPEQALIKVMERVIAMTERRLLNDKGRPYFDLSFYAVNKRGDYAGACAYEGASFAVADARGIRVEKMVYLYKASERPTDRPMSGTLVIPR